MIYLENKPKPVSLSALKGAKENIDKRRTKPHPYKKDSKSLICMEGIWQVKLKKGKRIYLLHQCQDYFEALQTFISIL